MKCYQRMFVATISFTPVDDLQISGKNSVRLLLYRRPNHGQSIHHTQGPQGQF